MEKPYYVINEGGEDEPFSLQKVYESARRAGASERLARKIARDIKRSAHPGMKTREIFRMVMGILRKENRRSAIRFSLKKAIRKLGPTGFPFEKYIGSILNASGFSVQLNQHPAGLCLRYEIDFLARKENLLYVGECKYRNMLGEGKVHSYVALANYARFLDLKDRFLKEKRFSNLEVRSILVTDARFTKDVIRFSRCRGVELLGWRYPRNRGLEYLIESRGLYPITILPSLKKYLADIFVSKRIMLVRDFLKMDMARLSRENKIPLGYLERLAEEGRMLQR